jgi:type III secretory pathway component EscS
MSVISPKGTNALCRSSRLVSEGSEDTWIVHFARAVAVAAMFPVRVSLLVSLSRIQEQTVRRQNGKLPVLQVSTFG